MKKKRVIKNIALIFSLIMLLTSTVQTTYGLIITKTEPIINIFTPFETRINDLIIKKVVEHPFSDDYAIPDDILFDFKVELGAIYANTRIQTTAGEMKTDANGVLEVSIHPYIPLGIQGLDEGTKVTVTEIEKNGTGFSVKDGQNTKEITVKGDEVANLEFTNIYKPAAIKLDKVSLNGTKTLTGRDWQAGDEFTFLLEEKSSEDKWNELGTKTIRYETNHDAAKSFSFDDVIQAIEIDKVGTYEYRLTEKIGELENITYDKTVNTFEIIINDKDMDGKLELEAVNANQNAKVTKTGDKYSIDVVFNNIFNEEDKPVKPTPKPAIVKLDVKKYVECTGTIDIGPSDFMFELISLKNGDKKMAKSNRDGDAGFEIRYTARDLDKTFKYKLREINDSRRGVTYDETVHDVEVAISLNKKNNRLQAKVTIDGEEMDKPIVAFRNKYHQMKPQAPGTGDDSNLTFWIIMMVVSAMAVLALIIFGRKSKAKG